MKNLPTGRQNFTALIEENLLYVDKTRQIYELIGGGSLYFLSRPRRFGKTLLNLTDLTLHPLAHDIVGITEAEMRANFENYIEHASKKLKLSQKKLLEGLKLWYDGYSFDGETFLYNPYSLLSFFGVYRFGNFWFSTGTPTFLVETIRDQNIKPLNIEDLKVAETFFDKFNIDNLDIYSLLFQTGYLTIKKTWLRGFELRYGLGYPNEEVRRSFIHGLLEAFTFRQTTIVSNALVCIEQALEEGDIEAFITQLKVLLSDISYHLLPKSKKEPSPKDELKNFEMWEGYFQTIIYLITAFLGFSVQAEVTKHKGRLDLIAQTDDFLYIMEFKLDEPAEDAIAQIKSRKYVAAYQNSPKTIILVGIGFLKEERNVETWEKEVWKKA